MCLIKENQKELVIVTVIIVINKYMKNTDNTSSSSSNSIIQNRAPQAWGAGGSRPASACLLLIAIINSYLLIASY